jgi:hypothetical protein
MRLVAKKKVMHTGMNIMATDFLQESKKWRKTNEIDLFDQWK